VIPITQYSNLLHTDVAIC